MTTKPKAKKFRIRRGATTQSAAAPRVAGTSGSEAENANVPPAGHRARPAQAEQAPKRGQVTSNQELTAEAEIDAIKREGLTGRELRSARRLAQQHNLPATSDYDAVRLLRRHGVDLHKRSSLMNALGAETPSSANVKGTTNERTTPKVQLPQTIQPAKQTLPSTDLSPAQRRDMEIGQIQRDIARRRRRKLALLMTRLAFFVFLPTVLVGWYFHTIATPMYSSKSEFVILQADGGSGGVGGLLAGTQFATSQDSISVQSFLESKEAMLLLDRDRGFKSHFSQDWIDPIQRMASDATNEEAYKTYSRIVTIGYDPTEGVIRMEVSAADPATATEFSQSLLSYAEDRVNNLSGQKREDQMREALQSFEDAQKERRNAQEALVELQLQGAVLDPENVIAGLRNRINTIELELQEKELQLAALLDNARPNKAKVEGTQADIKRMKTLLESLNAQMLDASAGENSLARLSISIQMAQADLASRDMMLQSAMQQVETTRLEANRQVRYLTVSVNPVPSQEPSYPRKFENTILAFLVFAGIYLMISLTASILREQVSS